MGLENTSGVVLKKIAASLGFSLTKKARSTAGKGSKGASGAAKSGSAASKASGLTRKRTLGVAGNGMDFAS